MIALSAGRATTEVMAQSVPEMFLKAEFRHQYPVAVLTYSMGNESAFRGIVTSGTLTYAFMPSWVIVGRAAFCAVTIFPR